MLWNVVPDARSRRRAHHEPPAAAAEPVNAAISASVGAFCTTHAAVLALSGSVICRDSESSMIISVLAPAISRYEVRRPGSTNRRGGTGPDSTAFPSDDAGAAGHGGAAGRR